MDASYYECFRKAIENVVAMMLQAEMQIEQPVIIETAKTRFDVSGMIGVSGDVTGVMILGFDFASAEKAVCRMTGMDIDRAHEDFPDAIGELANMIAGYAKARFVNDEASITCPSVIINKQHKIFRPRDTNTVRIRCHCDLGMFDVEVTMKNTNQAKRVA